MDGFERRREQKKKNIYKAALELFSQFSVNRVSIAEIAAKANVSQVTIYNYFGSKQELVKQTFMAWMDDIADNFLPLLESDKSFPEKLESLIFDSQISAKFAGDKGLIEAISVQDPDIQQFLAEYGRTKAIPGLMKLIEQGRNEGYVNPDVSTEAIMFYINIFHEATNKPGLHTQDNQKMLLDLTPLFFYGLLGKPAGKK